VVVLVLGSVVLDDTFTYQDLSWKLRETVGLKSFFTSSSRLLKLATKPGKSELWLSIKICLLGTIALGGIGFLIKLISFVLTGAAAG
jgi:protein translocase SEC61 complex gamma subunit